MCRKLVYSGAAAAVLMLLFFGRDCASYVGTSYGWVKDSVRNSVPIDFEIDRARKMVKDLVPEIRRNMQVIAKEEVEVERLQKEIATAEARVTKEKQDVLRLKNDLASPRDSYEYAGHQYTIKQVKLDLANRFERLKTNDATLASLRDIHLARTKGLEAARAKLEGMLAAKRQLEVKCENLDARLKMVEVSQTASELNVDESRLGRAKELVAELRSRLQVAEKLVGSESTFQGEIQLDEAGTEDIVDQVAEYLDGETAAPQPVVATK